MTPLQAWAVFIAVAAFAGISFAGIGWMIWKIRDYFRSWVIWWNEDAGRVEVERRNIKTETITRGKGTDSRAYFLDANARKAANKGNLYVLDVASGANLRGPGYSGLQGQLAAYATEDQVTFRICDPKFAYNKLQTNSYKKWLSTQQGEEDWRVKIAPLAFMAVIVMALVLGGVMWVTRGG